MGWEPKSNGFAARGSPGALGAEATEGATRAQPAPAQTFSGRGVYNGAGAVRSPVGAAGARSAFATNRIAIDDVHSVVRVDRASHRVVPRNEHRYGLNQLVGCLLLMGRGTTESGRSVPTAVHLKIHKTFDRFSTRIHCHPTVREKLVSAEFEPFEVILENGSSGRGEWQQHDRGQGRGGRQGDRRADQAEIRAIGLDRVSGCGGPAGFAAPLDTWFQKTIPAIVAPPGTGGLLVLAGVVSSDLEVPYALFVDEVFVPEPAAGLGAASALATLATFRMRWGRSVPTAGEGRPSATG